MFYFIIYIYIWVENHINHKNLFDQIIENISLLFLTYN